MSGLQRESRRYLLSTNSLLIWYVVSFRQKDTDRPAQKNDLLKHAQQQGASQDVLETLRNLHEGHFNSPADVSRAVGEIDHQHP